MVTIARRRLLAFLLAASCPAMSSAFVPAARTTSSKLSTTNLQVVPTPVELGDLSSMNHVAQEFFASTSTILSDAAAAAPKENSGGWWQSYLQIFKNILVFEHGLIDQPLKNVGIENTWGIAIALFTCSLRALLIPLSIQQNKNAEYMKALKPYLNEIKEKFPDNEQARNQATGKLFEDANQNPLAGCVVSLVQLPVLLGLYRGIRLLAIDGQLQEPFLWIPSLEGPVGPPDYRGTDWLTSGWYTDAVTGYPTPPMGWETTLAFLAMPAILVLLQTITLTVLQPPQDENVSAEEKKNQETTQLVFKFLPLMLGFFSLQVPAGLTIYWVTTNLFTLTQSLAVRAWFAANPPEINLPEYWDSLSSDKSADEMTPEEKRAAMKAGISVGPTMEDLKTESRFHTYIERTSSKSTSPSWQKVVAEGETLEVPTQLASWVGADASPSASNVLPAENKTAAATTA